MKAKNSVQARTKVTFFRKGKGEAHFANWESDSANCQDIVEIDKRTEDRLALLKCCQQLIWFCQLRADFAKFSNSEKRRGESTRLPFGTFLLPWYTQSIFDVLNFPYFLNFRLLEFTDPRSTPGAESIVQAEGTGPVAKSSLALCATSNW